MPAPSKKLKEKIAQLTNQAYELGVLARAINAIESCRTKENHRESVSDTEFLREMMFSRANRIYSDWYTELKSHQILTVFDKTLQDAGWDYMTFCVNRDDDDPNLIEWYTEI